jgi:hypothetical protein
MAKEEVVADRVLAPVDEYPEKKDDVRSEEETRLAEGFRHVVEDQDPTYRERLGLGEGETQDVDMAVYEDLKRGLVAEQLGVSADEVPAVVIPVNDPAPEPEPADG